MRYHIAEANEIELAWGETHKGFAISLRRSGGDMNLGQLYQQVCAGSARILVAVDEGVKGALVFRAETWDTGVKLRVLAMFARDFRSWRHEAMDQLHSIKDRLGANAIVFEGRVGHERLFENAKVLRHLYEVK